MRKPAYDNLSFAARPGENAVSNILTLHQAMQYFSMGEGSIYKLAAESNARIRYGRLIRYNRERMEKYLTTFEDAE